MYTWRWIDGCLCERVGKHQLQDTHKHTLTDACTHTHTHIEREREREREKREGGREGERDKQGRKQHGEVKLKDLANYFWD